MSSPQRMIRFASATAAPAFATNFRRQGPRHGAQARPLEANAEVTAGAEGSSPRLARFWASALGACPLVAAGGSPAGAVVNANALSHNALAVAARGSSLDELNGVAIESVALPAPRR